MNEWINEWTQFHGLKRAADWARILRRRGRHLYLLHFEPGAHLAQENHYIYCISEPGANLAQENHYIYCIFEFGKTLAQESRYISCISELGANLAQETFIFVAFLSLGQI